MSEIKYAMSIIKGKLKNADEHNLHYQRFSIADMEAILGVLSKSESDYTALQQKLDALAAESDTNLRRAASELNTSWMLHKTMMGAQAALLCLSQGDILSAKEWLEGTTDEAIIEMPDDLNPGDLQAWFDSHMVSNGGTNGFLTHNEALELLRKRAPATDAYLNSVRADAVETFAVELAHRVHRSEYSKYLEDEAIKFAANLRSGTHDTADKAG